jgi:lambda family phage tail tape measure protein
MPPAATQTRRIIISVDTKGAAGLKDIADKLGGVSKATKSMANNLSSLTSGFASFLGGLSIRELASFSDEIQNLNNRLVALTGSQEGATDTLNKLLGVSRETNQSLNSVADGYLRYGQAVQDAHISSQSLLDVTKTIANTFRLSGASTEETANATVQLSQAFSLGVLRGQDLRSVMSQNVVLTRLLRKEFGTELLKAAEKGLITVPKIFRLIFKSMDEVNKQAEVMKPTFEQSLTKAMDTFKLKIFEVSQALSASSTFATGIQWLIDHSGQLTAVFLSMATAAIPALIASVAALVISFGPLAAVPFIVAGITAAFIAMNPAVLSNLTPVEQLQAAFYNFSATIDGAFAKVTKFTDLMGDTSKFAFLKAIHEIAQSGADYANSKLDQLVQKAERTKAVDEAIAFWEAKRSEDRKKRQDEDLRRLDDYYKHLLTAKEFLADLNKAYEDGKLTIAQYNLKVLEYEQLKAHEQFALGKKELTAMNDALRKVEIVRFNQSLMQGNITLSGWRENIDRINLKELNEQLEAGKISLEEYDQKLAAVASKFSAEGAMRTGLADYLKSIGTVTQNVADGITNAFKNVEDSFVEFIKTGKFNFDKFTQGILDDLTRIIVRAAIVRPLADGILSAFPGSVSTAQQTTGPLSQNGYAGGRYGSPTFAMGGVFDYNGLKKFASGGVVSAPTTFGYGKGQAGVMGEAGPEAIIPLRRGSGGELGVAASVTPVNINIINQSGNEVQQQETTGPNGEKQIDILITNKVRDGIASGRYDKVFKQSYGMARKGS